MDETIPTSHGNLSGQDIIDGLMFGSYSANRDRGMVPLDFKVLGFHNVDAMEAKYQAQRRGDLHQQQGTQQ